MYFNLIKYDLQCNNCKTFKKNSMSSVQTAVDIRKSSENELIGMMNDFQNLQCEICGNKSNWKVLQISV